MKNLRSAVMSLAVIICLTSPGLAASLDSLAAATDPGSAMYTGENIYNRLISGDAGAKRVGPFAEPAAGPGASGHTLDEIMAALPAADNVNGAAIGDVLLGKTFWGLRTDGTWGLKTGIVPAGGNVTGSNGQLTFGIPDGLYSGSRAARASDSALVAGNIRSGATIFGVSGSVIQSSGNAAAGDVLSGKTYSNAVGAGTGAMPNQGTLNHTPGTSTLNSSAGYYSGVTVAGDADLVSGNIRSGVNIFGVSGSIIQATGTATADQVLNGAAFSNAIGAGAGTRPVITVPKSGQSTSSATGDDGDLKKGYAPPSPRFTDISNGTVIDNATGLVWLKDANCFGAQTWVNALTSANNLASPTCSLTDGSTAGQWRLPSVKELQSLIDFNYNYPSLTTGHPYAGVLSNGYWTSTSYSSGTNYAWNVYLSDGDVSYLLKTSVNYVWPVRDGTIVFCTGNPNGTSCGSGLVCQSGICVSSCSDGVKDSNETDIDCGGGTCSQCTTGKQCLAGADCSSQVCTGGFCAAPACTDSVKNGTETDIDCGGSCSQCANNMVCLVGADCSSRVCVNHLCKAPTCTDSVKNGTETDIDCGGGGCMTCANNKQCSVGTDCASGRCSNGLCHQ